MVGFILINQKEKPDFGKHPHALSSQKSAKVTLVVSQELLEEFGSSQISKGKRSK